MAYMIARRNKRPLGGIDIGKFFTRALHIGDDKIKAINAIAPIAQTAITAGAMQNIAQSGFAPPNQLSMLSQSAGSDFNPQFSAGFGGGQEGDDNTAMVAATAVTVVIVGVAAFFLLR